MSKIKSLLTNSYVPKDETLHRSARLMRRMALEPRILLDAAATSTVTETLVNEAISAQLDGDASQSNEPTPDETHEISALGLSDVDTSWAHTNDTTEIVFIDNSVPNTADLIASINPNAEIYFLDTSGDGVEQIAQTLAQYDSVDAVHIISHGSQGELFLGNDVLNIQSMQGEHADDLAIIRNALSANGDILIYGCDFTGGDAGLDAARLLSSLTGADVAASQDTTGHETLGGDWDLETRIGVIDADVIRAAAWQGQLALRTLAFDDFSSGDYSGGAVWEGDWVESDAVQDPNAGDVQIVGGELKLGGGVGVSAEREVDLSKTENTTITFDLTDSGDFETTGPLSGQEEFVFEVSTNGGLSYTILDTFDGTNASGPKVYALPFGSEDTIIRFRITNGFDAGECFTIDNIVITGEGLMARDDVFNTFINTPIGGNVLDDNGNGPDVDAQNGVLTITAINGIPGDVGNPIVLPSGASLTLNSDGTFTYTPPLGFTGVDSFVYQLSDDNGDIDFATVTINIFAANVPPTIDLDGDNSTGAVGNDYQAVYTENMSAVPIADVDTLITDFDDVNMESATITLTNPQTGDQLLIDGSVVLDGASGTTASGLSYVVSNGGYTITLTGTAANAVYADTIEAISFENTLDNFNTVDRIINVVVNDGDSDSNTAQATIQLIAVDDPLIITGLGNGPIAGTDNQVLESDLATGSNPSGTGEIATGDFTISAPDGIASLTVGGTVILLADLQNSGSVPIIVSGIYGDLTINGFNSSTGQVDYSYTLLTNADHSGGNIIDSFALVLTDDDGDTETGSLGIFIVNDLPTANDDVDEVVNSAGNPSSTATGNVVTGTEVSGDPNTMDGVADVIGADSTVNPVTGVVAGTGTPLGGNVGVTVTGTYGDLVLNADGSYTYTPDFTNPLVAGLVSPATLNDVFTYEITDGDDDTSTATLTITIVNAPAVVGLDDGTVAGTDGSVLESDLPIGTNPAGSGETIVDSFFLITPDGLGSVTIGGTNLSAAQVNNLNTTPVIISGTYGDLTLNGYDSVSGEVTYSYTLTSAADHSGGPVTDDFAITVTDADGDTGSGTLSIAIVNDVPIAAPDFDFVDENSPDPARGNVFTSNDTLGADQIFTPLPVMPVTGVVVGTGNPAGSGGNVGVFIDGLYGLLGLNGDGNYTYLLDNSNPTVNGLQVGETLTEIFTYEITDSDGDTSTATLTITIRGANDAPVPGGPDNDGNGIPDGGDVNITTPQNTPIDGQVIATDPDGDPLIYILDTPPDNGSVIVNPDGTYTYTPDTDYIGPDMFTVLVDDSRGGTLIITVFITVTPVGDVQTLIDIGRGIVPEPFDRPDDPDFFDPDAFVEADGIILDTVNGICYLHGTPSLTADWVVLTAVNGVDSLNGLEEISDDIGMKKLYPACVFDKALDDFGGSGGPESIKPFVGFSLYMDGDHEGTDDSDKADKPFAVESSIRDNVLYLGVTSLHVKPVENRFQSYSATLGDGRPLPKWISYSPNGLFVIHAPANVETVTLKITGHRSDDSFVTGLVEVDTVSAEIRELEKVDYSFGQSFSKAVERAAAGNTKNNAEVGKILQGTVQ